MDRIILASASPRRVEFLRLLGLPFSAVPAEIDETPPPGISPGPVAGELALAKALAVAGRPEGKTGRWVLGADTVVVLDGQILGKPGNREEAGEMLGRLSGRRHEVITAMALLDGLSGRSDTRSVSSEVEFADLSPDEITRYLDTGEWRGAAGGYRLQEKGACLVRNMNGSPSGVAGLPLREFCVMLRDNGYSFGA